MAARWSSTEPPTVFLIDPENAFGNPLETSVLYQFLLREFGRIGTSPFVWRHNKVCQAPVERCRRPNRPMTSARPVLARHCPELHPGLVVQRKPVDDVGAGPIIPDDRTGAAFAAQTRDDLVEGTHA